MGARKTLRLGLTLPVRVSGVDTQGRFFEQDATTIDITRNGARLKGIQHPLKKGGVLLLRLSVKEGKFRVSWVGSPGSVSEGHIGLRLIEQNEFYWGRPIPHISEKRPTECGSPIARGKPSKISLLAAIAQTVVRAALPRH